jgi:succinate-semialdehyde dehydrogenase
MATMTRANFAECAVSLNPTTGEELQLYPFESSGQIDSSLALIRSAFLGWSAVRIAERVLVIRRMAGVLRDRLEPMARMAALEMGKPVTQGRAEVEKCAALCEWYAENGEAMLSPEPTLVPGSAAYVHFRPLGPVLAVMPWNFPFWQVMRGAVAIILAGNTYVLKHAPNVMGCAYLLKAAWLEAGLPAGVFEVLNVTPGGVSQAIADDRIATVAVTGSVGAGRAIAAQAGAMLKKCVLELGGSDPFIVLADADVAEAVKAATMGRFQNTGQICIAAKRIIVEASIMEEFEIAFVDAVSSLSMGDPLDAEVYLGPMARYDLRDELDSQVKATVAQGARPLLGGDKIAGKGNFYEATVLSGVTPGMTSFDEEVFGPVASLISADDADHALMLANGSEFGLAGSLWTANSEVAQDLASRMVTGGVFINGYAASDPRVPIGGVKKSGFGRELSRFGIQEFCNTQTVWTNRRP